MSEEKTAAGTATAEKTGAAKPTKTRKKPAASKAATPSAPAAAGSWEVGRVLKVTKPLMKGNDVKALQNALIAHNYHCGKDGADGVFGKNTAYAVRCFQSHKRLVVDGRAGKYTVAALGGTWKE